MKPPPSGRDLGVDLGKTDGGVIPGVPAWHWESPRPQGNNLRSLWGIPGATSASDEIYAVGDSGTLLIGGSTGWQIQRGSFLDNRTILGVGGQGTGAQASVLAVGMFDLALRRTGGQWTDLNPLLGTGDGALNAVWPGPTAGEFFVVGTTGRIFWVKGNGTTWLTEGKGVTPDSLFAVDGGPNGTGYDVYAVGANGRVVRRTTGTTTWTVEADNLVAQQLNAVWYGDGGLSGEVFAAGDSGIVLHRKGGTWSTETPPTSNQLLALWGYGDELYAVGARGTILRRQGGIWLPEAMGLTSERLSALWGTVHDGLPVVYAAGSLGTILRRERGNWELLSTRVTSNPLASVWARNPSEVYAVGSDGLILRRSGEVATGSWIPAANGVTSSSLNAISGYSSSPTGGLADVYAVGADGTIVHQSTGGAGWAVEGVALTSAELTSVWVGADSVWVVGRGGRIGKKLAGVWSNENGPGGMPVTQDLFATWGVGQGTGQVTYVAGSGGLILRRELGVWKQEGAGLTTQTIVSLFGTGEGDLYAIGDKGAALHRVGGTWRQAPIGQLQSGAVGIAGTVVPGSSEMYTIGAQGMILHYAIQGSSMTWQSEQSLTTLPGSGVAAAAANDVYVVGPNGLILHKY